ncbi:MAG TPA: hypothetical protein VFM42_00445 [Sphingomicrobium sp.]|nr:hypothetical protein [Sphingomicrobium sp.]
MPFVLSVGITGHRMDVLPDASVDALRLRIRETLKMVEAAGSALFERECECFAAVPPRMRLVSPIADGADQIAADMALELGWELQVVLPFERGYYRTTLGNDPARKRFDELLGHAGRILELPGSPEREPESYAMAGRATVAHCDLLVALWDGLKARGRGGTGEVVEFAIARGTPIAHIPPEPERRARLLWAAFDPVVDTMGDDPMAERPLDAPHVEQMLSAILVPPPDPSEQKFLARFFAERLPRFRPRFEYALLLSVAGVRRIRARDLTEKHAARLIREEWREFRERCVDAHRIAAPIEILEEAYHWTDRLATNLAQTYRSGHVFGFVLGGLAVCMGLSAFMLPHLKLQEAVLEMVITIAIILNAVVGTKKEWHRRWLDYRQLAERLRPMRSLKLLGIAAPDPPGTETNPVPKRWIDWYASGIWRAMGCPSGSIDDARATCLAAAIADHEIAPQVAYHEHHAEQIEKLDHRLELIGMVLFVATLVVSVATIVGYAADAQLVEDYGNWFTLVSAGFPALGTAVFGIRFQGDFGGDALRSLATADTLRQIDQELRKDASLTRAADLTEQAARFMLSDLDEWRLVNQQRDLSVG